MMPHVRRFLRAAHSSSGRARPAVWLTALAAICIVTFALWASFGLRRAAWGDAWSYHGSMLNGVVLAPLLNSRPLNWLPWVVSYELAPASFLGVNLLIAWFVLLKGVLVYAIVRLLAPHAAGLALATALLAMIYPAEVGFFNDGYLNLHQGFDAYLLAVFFLLAYWRRRSGWMLVVAVAALGFSVFTYEAALALAVATPLLLIWQDRRISRNMARVSLLWWSPVAFYLLYIAALKFSGIGLNAREAGLLTTGLSAPNLPLEVINANLWNLGQRYVEGWREALTLSPFNTSSTLFQIAAVTGTLMAAVFYLHLAAARSLPTLPSARWPIRRWLELFALSILWTVLGYAVFSLASVRYDGWRLGFYTALGSSLTVALICYGITVHRRISGLLAAGCAVLTILLAASGSPIGWILLSLAAMLGLALPRAFSFPIVIGVLLTIAMVRQLDLHRWLTEEALSTQRLMRQVTLATPGIQANTPVVLVLDANNDDSDLPFSTSQYFDLALDLIHDNRGFQGIVCPVGISEWGWEVETCSFAESGLRVQRGEVVQTIPYEALVLVKVDADGNAGLVEQIPAEWGAPPVTSYNPLALLDPAVPPPARLETLFNPHPLVDR